LTTEAIMQLLRVVIIVIGTINM